MLTALTTSWENWGNEGAGASRFHLGYQIALFLLGSFGADTGRPDSADVYFLLSGVMVIGLIATTSQPQNRRSASAHQHH